MNEKPGCTCSNPSTYQDGCPVHEKPEQEWRKGETDGAMSLLCSHTPGSFLGNESFWLPSPWVDLILAAISASRELSEAVTKRNDWEYSWRMEFEGAQAQAKELEQVRADSEVRRHAWVTETGLRQETERELETVRAEGEGWAQIAIDRALELETVKVALRNAGNELHRIGGHRGDVWDCTAASCTLRAALLTPQQPQNKS